MCKKISKYRKIIIFLSFVIIFIPFSPLRALLFTHLWMNTDSAKDGIPPVYIENTNTAPRDGVEALYYAYEHAAETSGESFWNMIKRYPDNTALYANVLQYYIQRKDSELIYITSNTQSKSGVKLGYKSEIRSIIRKSPVLEKALYAIRMGEKLEPDNAYFRIFHAYLLFGLGHDQDSIAMLNSAANCKSYNSHSNDMMMARIKYGPKLAAPVDWFFPTRKYAVATSTTFPHLMYFMKFFKLIMLHANNSKPKQVIGTMDDIIHVASLIRDSKQQLIELMTGIAMQSRAITDTYYYLASISGNGTYKEIPKKTKISNRVTMLESMVPDKVNPESWQYIRQQAEYSDNIRLNLAAFTKTLLTNKYMKPTMGLLLWFTAQSRIVYSMTWIVIIWLVTNLSISRYRDIDFQKHEPKWYVFWLITALLSIPVHTIKDMHQYTSLGAGLWIAWTVGVSKSAFTALIIASVSRKRAPNDIGWFNKTWLARIRKGCIYSISGMSIIYLISMIAFIPAIINANKTMDYLIAHEAEIAANYLESANWDISVK